MKQIIDTGWKEFDRQTNCITTRNAYTNTQFSAFIRPWKKTECNGFTNPEGYLLDFDLLQFRKFNIPPIIKDLLVDKNREDSVILYMFFTTKEHIEPCFWIVTSRNHDYLLSVVVTHYKQNFMKRDNARREVLKYITNDFD